jgi:signal transduction histidine kinase
MMVDDADMPAAERQRFLGIVLAEAERLSRLVNQVLDLAKIESGNAQWHDSDVDMAELLTQAARTTAELLLVELRVNLDRPITAPAKRESSV